MEHSTSIPYSRISLFFVFVLALLTWGFYKTYIIFFPSFTGFNSVQHFHGAMMLTWMIILIIQPLLIRSGKRSAHRLIGRLTFVIAPLVVVSIFLASKMVYQRPQPPLPENEKIGMIALSIPAMIAFAILYCLAIANRRNTYNHMRYMIGTSLLMIGPGLGRALIVYFGMSLPQSVSFESYLTIGIATALLLNDVLNKKSLSANAIVLAVVTLVYITWQFRLSLAWQDIGGFIAKNFFS